MNKKSVKNPKVSIVIPVYNGEKYLKEAIDSALAQTYDNYEIIVVNDGSIDKTEDIAKSYGDKIRYFKKKNGGVSSALNLAIKKMSGEYFSWLSHDDTYEPNKLQAEIDFLREHNYFNKKIIVFSDYFLIDQRGKRFCEAKKDTEEMHRKPEYIIAKGHIDGLTLLIPKKAFDEYGGFDTKLLCVQDYLMWYKMSQTYKFIHIPQTLVSTRCHSEQTTNVSPKVVTEGNEFYINLIKNTPKKRMVALEGSEYCFLEELEDFYNNTVYRGVAEFCRKRKNQLLKEATKTIKKYKVSVIIPFYNRNQIVLRAINSVLKQTHSNFEIILVDDGSTDDRSQLDKLVKKHQNIILLKNNKNRGPSFSRNKGIKAATGDFIAFLDSDDEFVPKKLETMLTYAVASKANFLHSSYRRVKNSKTKVIHSGKSHGHCQRDMISGCGIATPTVILKRNWVTKENMYFNETLSIGEDTCYWLQLIKNNTYLVGVDLPLTVVNVGKNTAAYSNSKQVEGLKNIITYVLNDEYYSKYNQELSNLMGMFCHNLHESNLKQQDANTKVILMHHNTFEKGMFFLKNEGFKATSKRFSKKIRNFFPK